MKAKNIISLVLCAVSSASFAEKITKPIYSCAESRMTEVVLTLVWPDEHSTSPDLMLQESQLGNIQQTVILQQPQATKSGNNFHFNFSQSQNDFATISIEESTEDILAKETVVYKGSFDLHLKSFPVSMPPETYCQKLF